MDPGNNFIVILPVLLPLVGAGCTLIFRRNRRLQSILFGLTLTGSLIISGWLVYLVWQSQTALVLQAGGWPAPFGISLVADMLAVLMVLMSQLVLATGMLYSLGSKDQAVRYPAFPALFLTLAAGLSGAFLTGDLFNLYVFAELVVISGAVLTAISDDRYGIEAAYKYFYISLLASVFLLLAIGSLYAAYGSLNMADLAVRIAADPGQPLLPAAIALLLAAFMIKSAVFPFHFWQPDFHTTSPTAVSAMLSSVVVKLGVYGFVRMTTLLFTGQAAFIHQILIGLGIAGILYGGLAAIGTYNAKRMLAYSTLAQVGFILVAIGWGTPLALVAALVFIVNHSLIKAGMLMLAGAVASRSKVKSANFETLTGLGRLTPAAGVMFFIGSLALAGLPPTNGFISKLLLFRSGIELQAIPVLILVAGAGLLTLIYTLRAFQKIWWHDPDEAAGTKPAGDRLISPGILIGLALVLGIWAEPMIRLAQDASLWLLEPARYIQAVMGG